MTIGWESLLWTVISYSLTAALLFFCFRAYRRSTQRGFLLLGFALVIWPFIGWQIVGPLLQRLLDEVRDGRVSRSEFALVRTLPMSVGTALFLAWSLILLARPLHRGRRA